MCKYYAAHVKNNIKVEKIFIVVIMERLDRLQDKMGVLGGHQTNLIFLILISLSY
jgi:hypothetical protein